MGPGHGGRGPLGEVEMKTISRKQEEVVPEQKGNKTPQEALAVPKERRLDKAATFIALRGDEYRFQISPDHVAKDDFGLIYTKKGEYGQFHDGNYATYDSHIAKMLLKSPSYGMFYVIDEADPTGYWESVGFVETIEVKMTEKKLRKVISVSAQKAIEQGLTPEEASGIETEPEKKTEEPVDAAI